MIKLLIKFVYMLLRNRNEEGVQAKQIIWSLFVLNQDSKRHRQANKTQIDSVSLEYLIL